MEGISKYLRLRTVAVAAVVAAGLGLMAMSASASVGATCIDILNLCTKKISLGIRNSSKATISVERCGGEYAHNPGSIQDRVCSAITTPLPIHVSPGNRLILHNGNPVGVIIRAVRAHPWDPVHLKTLYFYVKNPDIGLPFFRWPGSREIELREGQFTTRYVDGVQVEFRRYADEDRDGESVKLMRIEILKWPGAV